MKKLRIKIDHLADGHKLYCVQSRKGPLSGWRNESGSKFDDLEWAQSLIAKLERLQAEEEKKRVVRTEYVYRIGGRKG